MIAWYRGCRAARPGFIPLNAKRWLSASALEQRLAEPVQLYISNSRDPYVNLSVEHYLLQRSAPESAVLFLYRNRPSIIIGRNQIPWLEVNLALLKEAGGRLETEPLGLGAVDLVRRRSGGGTVFHDEGNVNWTIICPSSQFTRDKHAEMIVRALRSCGVDRSRVNERHDIVLDQGPRSGSPDPSDTHMTPYTKINRDTHRPLKVSGSAYKLTRGRALHHGTCLLSSPNLNVIPYYLHSPAKPYITARGVESVSSPVGNILINEEDFVRAVSKQFQQMYSPHSSIKFDEVGDELLEVGAIRKGLEELKSTDWKYLQTPQFMLSNAVDGENGPLIELTVRHGIIIAGSVTDKNFEEISATSIDEVKGQKLHEIGSWESALEIPLATFGSREKASVVDWLERMLPAP